MMYPIQEAEQQVVMTLKNAIEKLHLPDSEVKLTTPPNPEMGEYSYPCFSYAKIAKKSPNQIAEDIKNAISENIWIKNVTTTGPYVNIAIDHVRLAEQTIEMIKEKKDTYGHFPHQDTEVIIEHTSANPNGPLHVGRARNPIIGDTIVRLYRASGYTVDAQFYLDDLGKQVAILAWGLNNINPDELPAPEYDKQDHKMVAYYQEANARMEKDERVKTQIGDIVRLAEHGDGQAMLTIKEAYTGVLEGIIQSLERINIHIDTFIPESTFVKDHSVDRVIEQLNITDASGIESDGARYLDLEGYGVQGRNTKFYYLRSDGTTLYATRDIAYHHWKASQAERLINILGEDHKLEATQVRIALEITGASLLPHPVFYSFVGMPGGKMSTRRGRVVYLDTLIDEIIDRAYAEVKKRRGEELTEDEMHLIAEKLGCGAIRYNIIKVQPEKDIIFRLEDALNFEGNALPFVQYSHARAASILRKSDYDPEDPYDPSFIVHPSELALVNMLAKLPNVITEATHGFKPHLLTTYLFETAGAFNQFYRDCPVNKENDRSIRQARLFLVASTKQVLHNAMDILGVESLLEM